MGLAVQGQGALAVVFQGAMHLAAGAEVAIQGQRLAKLGGQQGRQVFAVLGGLHRAQAGLDGGFVGGGVAQAFEDIA
ncbi:hypothetical protein D3C81_1726650 [compost metagenome]